MDDAPGILNQNDRMTCTHRTAEFNCGWKAVRRYLGQARAATRGDGTLVGIRKPLAAHEQPIMRAIVIQDGVQHGLWQR
jgi:hypothetical protein